MRAYWRPNSYSTPVYIKTILQSLDLVLTLNEPLTRAPDDCFERGWLRAEAIHKQLEAIKVKLKRELKRAEGPPTVRVPDALTKAMKRYAPKKGKR